MKREKVSIRFPNSTPRGPLYFGIAPPRPGHFVFESHFRKALHDDPHRLWLMANDGRLVPKISEQKEGIAALRHWGGLFSTLGWWDRSVDKRLNSNSVVLVPGLFTATIILDVFVQNWPDAKERMFFPIVVDECCELAKEVYGSAA